MSVSEEIYGKVAGVLADSLNVDEDDITPTATLQGDLGAEAIFQGDPDFVQEGKVTEQGMAELRTRMPFADLEAFDRDRRLSAVSDLFTVGLVARYIAWKLDPVQQPCSNPSSVIVQG